MNDIEPVDPHELIEYAWQHWRKETERALEIAASVERGASTDSVLRGKALLLRAMVETRYDVLHAFRMCEEATELLIDDGSVWTARRLVLDGFCSAAMGNNARALEATLRALAIAEPSGDYPWIARCAAQAARILNAQVELDAARRYLDLAMSAAERCDEQVVASVLRIAADNFSVSGDREAAIECQRRVVDICERGGDPQILGRVLANLSDELSRAGRHTEAIVAASRALDVAIDNGYKADEATALRYIGTYNLALGDLATACDYFVRSREIFQQLGIVDRAAVVSGLIADIMAESGDLERAIDEYQYALDIAKRLGQTFYIGYGHSQLGEAYRQKEEFERALSELEKARHAFEPTDRAGLGFTFRTLGSVYTDLGRCEDAKAAFDRAAQLYDDLADVEGAAAVRQERGRLALREGAWTSAIEHLLFALEVFERAGRKQNAGDIYRQLADAYELGGMLDDALRCFRAYDTSRLAAMRTRALNQLHMRELEIARRDTESERARSAELALANERIEAAHRELKDAQTQLVHSEKMASLGQLTAGIAHEINNPVNFIRNSTSPLRRDLDEVRSIIARALEIVPDDLRKRVEERMASLDLDDVRGEIDALLRGIEEGATRTADIVQGLRTFSRLDEDDMKSADLVEGIESTIRLLHSRFGERITIVRQLEELPAVQCRPGQINQVVMNLLSNAIDAIDGIGEIGIRAKRDAQSVRIAISDSGRGIEPHDRDRLFEPFFTTKPVGSGTGLGLSISHSIVEAHGGRIEVESAPGLGSTFTIVLPLDR